MTDSAMQAAIIDLINKTTASASEGAAFLSGQLPDVINQLIYWEASSNAFWGVVLVSLAVWMFTVARKNINALRADTCGTDDEGVHMFLAFAGTFVALVAGPIGLSEISDFIQIMLAPKVYLIHYAAGLLHPCGR